MKHLLVLVTVLFESLLVSLSSSAESPEGTTPEDTRSTVSSRDVHALLSSARQQRTILMSEDLVAEESCEHSLGITPETRDAQGVKVDGAKLRGGLCLYGRQWQFRVGKIKRPKFWKPDKERGLKEEGPSKPFKYEIGVRIGQRSNCGVVAALDLGFGNPFQALGLGCTMRFSGLGFSW